MFGGLLEAPVSLPKQQKTNFLEWCSLYSLVVEGYYTVEAIFYLLHQVTGEREIELQFPVMMCLLVAVGNRAESSLGAEIRELSRIRPFC